MFAIRCYTFSTSIRALRAAACTPDASKQEFSRTVAFCRPDTPSFINRFDAWLPREGSRNKEACREQSLYSGRHPSDV